VCVCVCVCVSVCIMKYIYIFIGWFGLCVRLVKEKVDKTYLKHLSCIYFLYIISVFSITTLHVLNIYYFFSVSVNWLDPSFCDVNCTVGKPCEYRDEVDFRIIVMTFDRPHSLNNCLTANTSYILDVQYCIYNSLSKLNR